MKRILLGAILFLCFVQVASAELLPYRPACADPATVSNKPWNVTDHYPNYGTTNLGGGLTAKNGAYNLCYINNSMMYITYNWGNVTVSGENKLFRDYEDIYSTNIGGQSNALKAKNGFTVHLEYYFPSDGGICYQQDLPLTNENPFPPNNTLYGYLNQPGYASQTVTFNNLDFSEANCGGCTDFADANYDLTNPIDLSCDEWHTFEYSSNSFENEFGNKDRLVSFNMKFTNAYLRNVWFQREGVFYQLY